MISKDEIHISILKQYTGYIHIGNKYITKLSLDTHTMRFGLSYHLLLRISQNLRINSNFDQDPGPLDL